MNGFSDHGFSHQGMGGLEAIPDKSFGTFENTKLSSDPMTRSILPISTASAMGGMDQETKPYSPASNAAAALLVGMSMMNENEANALLSQSPKTTPPPPTTKKTQTQDKIVDVERKWSEIVADIRTTIQRHNSSWSSVGEEDIELPKGVTKRPSGAWQAQIYFSGKTRYIGVWETALQAAAAYNLAKDALKDVKKQYYNTVGSKMRRGVTFATPRRESKLNLPPSITWPSSASSSSTVSSAGFPLPKLASSPSDTSNGYSSSAFSQNPALQIVSLKPPHAFPHQPSPTTLWTHNRSPPSQSFLQQFQLIHEFQSSQDQIGANQKALAGEQWETNISKGKKRSKDSSIANGSKRKKSKSTKASTNPNGNDKDIEAQNQKWKTIRAEVVAIVKEAQKSREGGPNPTKTFDKDVLRGITVRPSGKFQAQLYYAGRSRYIGVFDSEYDAATAYEMVRSRLKDGTPKESLSLPSSCDRDAGKDSKTVAPKSSPTRAITPSPTPRNDSDS